MKIVIEIDDADYNYAKNFNRSNVLWLDIIHKVMTAIANGKVMERSIEPWCSKLNQDEKG